MFDQQILGDIRDRVPIVSFIGERIPLKKAGRNYRGLCPFHQEKTPSFMVSDEKQIYHCFGCGEGGDVFKFLMKFEGLTFAESVRQLAGRAGVSLPKDAFSKDPDEEIARKKKWCYRLNQIAAEYFQALLSGPSGAAARNYLKSRDIFDETSTQLFLGYAEKGWDGLIRHLEEKKVPIELAAELGLVKKRSGSDGYYDFFRGRLMFPIISPRGEILGFSGRALDESDKEAAKYLNSPDSVIYHKSNCVFGLNLAQDAVRKSDQLILVEGNIDLVSLYQSGIKNVVAPLGTALTSGHIRLLARYSKNVVVIFDGDDAGSKAAVRALPLFIAADLTPRAVAMPKDEDPDSFVKKHGAQELKTLLDNAPTLFEHVVDVIAAGTTGDTAGRIAAMQKIIPLLKEVDDEVALGIYRGYAAKRLKIKEEILRDALRKSSGGRFFKVNQPAATPHKEGEATFRAERLLIETIIAKPDLVPLVYERLKPDQLSDRSCRTIAELIIREHEAGGEINFTRLLDGIADPELALDIRSIAMGTKFADETDAKQVALDCLDAIEERPVTEKIEQINEAIRDAESEGNENLLLELLAKKRDLKARQKEGKI